MIGVVGSWLIYFLMKICSEQLHIFMKGVGKSKCLIHNLISAYREEEFFGATET